MHANAKLHRLVGGAACILAGYRRLHSDRTLDGIDRAGEVGDDAVASGVEDPATMRGDQLVDNGAAGLQPGDRLRQVALSARR